MGLNSNLCPAPPTQPRIPGRAFSDRLRDAFALIGLALIAGCARLYQLPKIPPGLHHDEAVNGLDVIVTIPRLHPIFFEANNGREPLFIYLQWISANLFGPSGWSLRVTSAVVGTLTVLAVYWLAREWYGQRIGVVAGFALATSFWHLDLSRIGLRAIAAPLFLTLAIACLWRGRRDRRLVWCALAGLFLAADLYTYSSARVAALIIPAILAWETVRAPWTWRRQLLELVVVTAVATVLVAPLGAFFASHPDYLIHRADQVWIFNPNPKIEGKPVGLVDNLWNTLGMFFVRGDLNPRQNIPGRPVFDFVAAPWFIVALGVLPWRTWRTWRSTQASRNGIVKPSDQSDPSPWVLLWIASFLALGALTYESPDFLRLSSLAPPTYVAWALGLVLGARWIARRVGARKAALGLASTGLIVGLVGYEAARTGVDYFGHWATRTDVYEGFDAGLTAAARFVQNIPPGRFLAFYVDRSPNILFQAPRSRSGRWLQEYSDVLLLPADQSAGETFVFAGDGSVSHAPDRYFSRLRPAGRAVDPAGNLGFVAFDLSPKQVAALLTPAVERNVRFGGADGPIEMVGFTLDRSSARPGESVGLNVLWRVRGDHDTVFAPYLHVIDAAGHSWGQDDLKGYVVNGWKSGDVFLSRLVWTVPIGTPPDGYRFEVGMATRAIGFPPGPAVSVGEPLDLATVSITGPSILPVTAPLPAMPRVIDQDLGGGLHLVGTSNFPATAKPGDRLEIELLWQARTIPSHDVRVDLVLDDGQGHAVTVASGRPAANGPPTSQWKLGTVLRDPRWLSITVAAPTGPVHLVAIGHDARTGQVLGSATLGTITVLAPPRDFALPRPDHPLNTHFGDSITLLGYDLAPTTIAPNAPLRLTLFWQDQRTPDRDYAVFAHLLDSGNHVVAQRDGSPNDGKSPTLGWVPGQVIADTYELTLKDPSAWSTLARSTLTLEVGMYDPSTGVRLPTDNGDTQRRIILTTVPVGGPSG